MPNLKNLTRRIRSFNLEHPKFVAEAGDNGLGNPESLTLLPLEAKVVPDEALLCREIKAALNPTKGRPTLRVLA